MRLNPKNLIRRAGKQAAGFTLAEVLAALTFMAIVIPAAVEGLQIASRAGQVSQRKAAAARIADNVLNELLVTGQIRSGSASGRVEEGLHEYRWLVESKAWSLGNMRSVTVRVTYQTQGRDLNVSLSTLVDGSF